MSRKSRLAICAGAAASVALLSPTAHADHWWGGYYWRHTSSTVSLTLADNVSGAWDPVLDTTMGDWQQSSALNLTRVQGSGSTRSCKAEPGLIKVCNDAYGYTGWLGIAQIWLTGDVIQQAVTKLNDSYFNSTTYNTLEWRNLVSCQEVGHAFGLTHQDEDFSNANLDTCMDYTRSPASNQHPNAHDYEQLGIIYGQNIDTSGGSSGGSGGGGPPPGRGRNNTIVGNDDIGNVPQGWGRVIGYTADGRPDLYELRLGDGRRVVTHVFNIPGAGRNAAPD